MKIKYKHIMEYLQDALLLLAMGGVLYIGASWQMFWEGSDAAYYQCYAVAFWQGWSGLQKLPPEQCTFLTHPDKNAMFITQDDLLRHMRQWRLPSGLIQFFAAQSPEKPYHTLPHEYPWITLLPLSLALIVPVHWYQVAFAIEMFLLIGSIYVVLLHWRSRQAALAYALYVLIGGASTAMARIDIVPAGLSLFALICAVRRSWNWAFGLLALATLSKIYPVILLVPFVLTLQRDTPGKWYIWSKWLPVALFVGICVLVTGVSLALSVVGTLAPLGYFAHRPTQIESLLSSILWLCSLLGNTSQRYTLSFDSLNVLSPWSESITLLLMVLLVVGLLSTWWLQWRGRIDLAMACLLTVLMLIVTGKVFSPQYLIWVFPLVAYKGESNRWWLFFWAMVGCLTSLIYPYMYPATSSLLLRFYLLTTVRNFLLLGFSVSVLIWKSGFCHWLCHHRKKTEYGKPRGEEKNT